MAAPNTTHHQPLGAGASTCHCLYSSSIDTPIRRMARTDNSGTSLGSRAVDLVISNATVVTMNAEREVLREAEVVISDRRIVKVGPPTRGGKNGLRQTIDARGRLLVPGFIHGHLHACQTLCRNRADGLELLDWLRERIWPFEAAHDAE